MEIARIAFEDFWLVAFGYCASIKGEFSIDANGEIIDVWTWLSSSTPVPMPATMRKQIARRLSEDYSIQIDEALQSHRAERAERSMPASRHGDHSRL